MSVYELPDHQGSRPGIILIGRYQALISEGVRTGMQSHQFSTPILVTGSQPSVRLERIHLGNGRLDEEWLQRQIHDAPYCLPIDEVEPAFGDLIPVCMELSTPHGFIDNLFLTPTGDIVLAEVKLWRNPEMRRKVVAQALDYVAWLFSMDYEGFEAAVLGNKTVQSRNITSLYELASHVEQINESAFVDAVSRNLSIGRAVVLIVGDGIRSETQALVSLLEDYGNLQFSFALIELAVFTRRDCPDEYLICPRILAKTEMLRRTVFDIQAAPRKSSPIGTASSTRTTQSQKAVAKTALSISSEQFWEAMAGLDASLPEKLQSFLRVVEELGVSPEFKRSLILRWTSPEGQPVNLGYIERNGKVWTNDVHNKLPGTMTDPYVRQLASILGSSVRMSSSSGRLNLANDTGGGILITDVADKLDGWKDCIATLIESVRNSPDAL